ncbi:MAG: transcription termination factor NusA [Patescibacteria group bacterium]|nr:transcription termination factor NusA [Patescibacteria group bacterium]
MFAEIVSAIKQVCDEKGLSYQAVIETIESALAAAYRKDFGEKNQNIKVVFDPETGKSKIYDVKTVVEDLLLPDAEIEDKKVNEQINAKKSEDLLAKTDSLIDKEVKKDSYSEILAQEERKFNSKTQIQLSDAKLLKKTIKVGDEIKTKLTAPDSYGRMAAQTAKQVIIQKLREAERDMVFNNFKNKEHEVIVGVVQRREGRIVLIDLDKAVGVLPSEEQIYGEKYNSGDRIKIYVKAVNLTPRGSEIILSRISDEILKKVFYLEIPEISNGLVEIKAVVREAGNRSKVAVFAIGDNVDPIGSCVGQRGVRIQTIIKELGGEKIDIIEYNEEPAKFISNALSPAKVLEVNIDNQKKQAIVKVADDQLSLAIGKDGQNVRLAAHLTGWKLDIVSDKNKQAEIATAEIAKTTEPTEPTEPTEIIEELIKSED